MMATRVSKSGGWMSAIRPHSKRERRRSSISGMSFGEESLETMICFRDSCRSLNVWKNSSCVRSLPEMNWMSSMRRRSIVREIRDGHAGEEAHALVPDGVQEVCLPEPNAAVDEERVVRPRRKLGDGLARRLSELVRRAHDERVEGVAGVQSFDRRVANGRAIHALSRRRLGGGGLVDDERDAWMAAEALEGRLLDSIEVVLGQPIPRELVRCADAQVVALDRNESAWADPVVEDRCGERSSQGIEESSPKVIQHVSRPHLHTELCTTVDSSGHLARPEFCAATRAHRDTTPHADPRTMDGGL